MIKIYPTKPFLLLFYGYPGAGKTYFARQFCDNVQAAHLQADRIRGELFSAPKYDQSENSIVAQLMNYMAEEFLSAGLSVAYDVNALRGKQRRALSDMARRYHAQPLLVWFQMDQDTAFGRNAKRDRRRADDKYAAKWNRTDYEQVISHMQNPAAGEDYVVVSGKHLFSMQQSAVLNRLRQAGVVSQDDTVSRMIKPGLVNLVPGSQRPGSAPAQGPGRFDISRRNISIR